MQGNFHNYFQLALLFVNGFLISRLFIRRGIAERAVAFFIRKSKGHISWIVIYLLFTSALISMFIPNVITVLALLPLLEILGKDFSLYDTPSKSLKSSLAMANLYGANIGGTGSINGSPAHLMLLGFLALKAVPGYEQFNFVSWLGWGLPLVLVLTSCAGLILVFLLIPRHLRRSNIDFQHFHAQRLHVPLQKPALILSIFSFLFWLFLSTLNLLIDPGAYLYTSIAGILYLLFFLTLIFFYPYSHAQNSPKEKLLAFKDCFNNLPAKGFILIIITFSLSGILLALKVDKLITPLISYLIPANPSLFWITLLFCLATVFISEFISNTATAISFFIISLCVAQSSGLPALPMLLAISLVSTIPSMSPIASPVNAMAYGGVKGISYKKMLIIGFLVDIIGALVITLLTTFVIPWYYNVG